MKYFEKGLGPDGDCIALVSDHSGAGTMLDDRFTKMSKTQSLGNGVSMVQ